MYSKRSHKPRAELVSSKITKWSLTGHQALLLLKTTEPFDQKRYHLRLARIAGADTENRQGNNLLGVEGYLDGIFGNPRLVKNIGKPKQNQAKTRQT